MDLGTLVAQMKDSGYFSMIMDNPRAQFRQLNRRYYGAELLPEKKVDENRFRDDQVRFRTIIANDGTRYSPTQKKDGNLIGWVDVDLGEVDIARELTGREYDALLKLLGSNSSMESIVSMANWVDTTLNRALLEKSEKERWEAIVNAQILKSGDNAYAETVFYSNPTNHRTAVGGDWSDDTYDPFDDIFAKADLLYQKGFMISRIFSSRRVVSIMGSNDKVKARTGRTVVSPTGQIQGTAGRADFSAINAALNADGLPNIELYDLQYRTQTGSGRFLPNDVMVYVCTTGRDENYDIGDGQFLPLADTLGYYALGRAAGQEMPGRVVKIQPYDNKPPRIEGEAWATQLPVILEPEAIAVSKLIN